MVPDDPTTAQSAFLERHEGKRNVNSSAGEGGRTAGDDGSSEENSGSGGGNGSGSGKGKGRAVEDDGRHIGSGHGLPPDFTRPASINTLLSLAYKLKRSRTITAGPSTEGSGALLPEQTSHSSQAAELRNPTGNMAGLPMFNGSSLRNFFTAPSGVQQKSPEKVVSRLTSHVDNAKGLANPDRCSLFLLHHNNTPGHAKRESASTLTRAVTCQEGSPRYSHSTGT